MIKAQKIIKYFAIGFAIFLTVDIISMIMYGVISIGTMFNHSDDNYLYENLEVLEVNSNISSLDIEIASSNVILKEGNTLKVETNNKYIKTKETNNKLSIVETKHNLFNNTDTSDLIIYIPNYYTFDNISIENGAGKVEIEKLITNNLNLDLGAGKVNVNNLIVNNNTEIDGGAGEIIITNGNINDLDLVMGVGKLILTSIITGDSEIDAGIGELELNLIGTIDDYKIILDKGIGNATLDDQKMEDSTYYGNGTNIIDLSGGIGNIKINLLKNY